MSRTIGCAVLLACLLGPSAPARAETSAWVVRTYEHDWDNGEETRTYAYRVAAYGPRPTGPIPLLVQLHEWVEEDEQQLVRPEEIAYYEDERTSFAMLYFEHAPADEDYPPPFFNWWWGDVREGRPSNWTEERLLDRVHWTIDHLHEQEGFEGVAIDPDRVYVMGHSMGGTGAIRFGSRHPEVFAALFAHNGYAEVDDVGLYAEMFAGMLGERGSGLQTVGDDGNLYDAWDYFSVSWWLIEHHGRAFDPPFLFIHNGGADEVISAENTVHLVEELEAGGYGFMYSFCPTCQHSDEVFAHLEWMLDLRRDQSYPAFSNNGANAGRSYHPGSFSGSMWNDRAELWFDPESILDEPAHYEVELTAPSPVTADVTLRRLQSFTVAPGGSYRFWTDGQTGEGQLVAADGDGLLTIPQVQAPCTLIVEPAEGQAVGQPGRPYLVRTIDG